MNVSRLRLAFAAVLVTLLPSPADAIPLLGLSLTVDQVCPDPQCGYVTAELVRVYSAGGPDDTRGVFVCTAVVPGAIRVYISCTYEDVAATDVSGLPVAAVAVGAIGGDGGPSDAELCLHLSADMIAGGTQNYDKCYMVLNIGS